MKNTITVSIPFSFKGVDHEPSAVIDLDLFLQNNDNFNFIYHQVATENKIDSYSYEYEVLESSKVFYSNPTGEAVDFLKDNVFDVSGFKQRNNNAKIFMQIQGIAKEVLGIEDLNDVNNAKIKQALLLAYKANGKEQ